MIGRGRDLSQEREVLTLHVRSTLGERLDRYVLESMVWKSRSRIQELIRDGRITVNGETSKPSRRVHAGDVIELRLSSGVRVPRDYSDQELEVLYEDEWLVAINKPADLLVHPVGRHVYDTLLNYLHHRYHDAPDEAPGGGEGTAGGSAAPVVVPRLCHRLDRDTTGVVVVAKDAHVHREVMRQFERREVVKEYLALVEGSIQEPETTVRVPIGEGRCLRSSLEHPQCKDSETLVRVERRLPEHTLVRCRPLTGRQNQIRIHLAALGHPIAGDLRFGSRPPPAALPQRYLLHAAFLRLHHPRLKSPLELAAPLPDDFRAVAEGTPHR
jgi:23S rRNA pseudouridine1911/1915/1917 synthase